MIHDYRLRAFIERGGFGEVWLAENRNTRQWYALKVVYQRKGAGCGRFEEEFHAIQRFAGKAAGSEHLIEIHHVGREPGKYFFYVMELADDLAPGRVSCPEIYQPSTLDRQLLVCSKLSEGEAIRIAISILEALMFLHDHGLLHEDVKPGNIVFVGGRPKLADPGLVTFVGQLPFACTPRYARPEGPSGRPEDDTYSVGKLLWEMITGLDPRQLEGFQIETLQLASQDAPLNLWSIIGRACAKDSSLRYQTARQMKNDLEALTEN